MLAREDGSCLLEIKCTAGDVNLPERLGKLEEFLPQRLNNNQPSQLMETRLIFSTMDSIDNSKRKTATKTKSVIQR